MLTHLGSTFVLLCLLITRACAAEPAPATATAVFGGGCFWCIEATFQTVEGVTSVTSGYAGGQVDDPSYEQVCGGQTGHAEVVRVVYDPAKVPFKRLLALFWKMHDPTTLNRQGHDKGTQYRSIILVPNERERLLAEAAKMRVTEALGTQAVTEIGLLTTTGPARFHAAEGDHQNYYRTNPEAAYCRAVIKPKLDAFLRELARTEP